MRTKKKKASAVTSVRIHGLLQTTARARYVVQRVVYNVRNEDVNTSHVDYFNTAFCFSV